MLVSVDIGQIPNTSSSCIQREEGGDPDITIPAHMLLLALLNVILSVDTIYIVSMATILFCLPPWTTAQLALSLSTCYVSSTRYIDWTISHIQRPRAVQVGWTLGKSAPR